MLVTTALALETKQVSLKPQHKQEQKERCNKRVLRAVTKNLSWAKLYSDAPELFQLEFHF